MIEHNAFMMESSDFIVDFGERQQEPVEHLDVVSHEDYFAQNYVYKNLLHYTFHRPWQQRMALIT